MVQDKDIYRAAKSLVKNYGEDAADECFQVAHRWKLRGDEAAAELWQRVAKAVEELRQNPVVN